MNTSRHMNINSTIDVAAVVAPVLASRDVISTLKTEIERTFDQKVQLDFALVVFISRSAAHELLRLKEQLLTEDTKKEIEFINANSEVSQMLRTVASNRAVPKTKEETSVIETISIEDLETPPSPFRFLKRLFAN